ncbi:Asp-tRNA(Asn)/Glu-tRNA(Gln) amidotransferase subunit GatB [Treponema phagedenis]|uniref:Aspartyl/glutamyl-tRNA(Asn/Gln) amidotransferase subunit B n=1 Tax=Treponema phagedenis TaxID=162 RepID=A0A0B7GYJ2_TREPH|nr:Asp-tRNA(Asn)/Glu-tRNA(Gln) amidotransferase subunit GatB [Treponema phagedenis]NVP25186.1 Asp-tRNA(Asn)/Glu-tRNA(Gln) amidotransferase subunit GatB [Treponema phagedenis]QEJ95954.1 Asp-tRNA(Asn)/Glu-tRNA(Gln) amidotransferase subunit GatB [Treponema phagedenis]QEJ97302.1 Asp-tRNA(Asn)/Glu-tRNA(Gln) amidotransferase subunit GatB [Treponema phagedenis]QEK00347.1 Asp-tRNA(Asn)/Glu-tRNA(Gln) amidotransferase subunit GatB [Treponema phagedenis]QEK02504.1 Asp-tRNA(Asn)/Glu-tRNA(Gln) amidotransfe
MNKTENGLEYEVIIGCEIHCQLLTKTKAFCSCENRYGGMPNTRVCPVCLGLPGALPVISEEYVRLGIKAGAALGCTINAESKFDRKHYFYPDLVKGYQITQYDIPLCENGVVEITEQDAEGKPVTRNIRVERIHLEEDVGKSLHIEGAHSYIDYNRCGVPLIEIVSKPDMKSPEEAAQYMQTVREILKFIGVTDGNLEEGAMRCDANINLKIIENGKEYRTPISEIKNMNSFRAVRDACAYEVKRQLEEFQTDRQLYSDGFKRTMGWDEPNGKTVIQRTKNSMIDYRFMREPDVKPLRLSKGYIQSTIESVGELPAAKRERFQKEYNLSAFDVQTLTAEKELADWFEQAVKSAHDPKKTANWILAEVLAVLNEKNISLKELPFTPPMLAELVNAIDGQKITGKQAKEVFAEMLATGKAPNAIIAEKGMEQISDSAFIETIVSQVFTENPQAIKDWKNGKTNVAGWLMGQVMKKSKGKANPQQATDLVNKKLQAE